MDLGRTRQLKVRSDGTVPFTLICSAEVRNVYEPAWPYTSSITLKVLSPQACWAHQRLALGHGSDRAPLGALGVTRGQARFLTAGELSCSLTD